MKNQRRITLDELQHELNTWVEVCKDSGWKPRSEIRLVLKSLKEWADMNAV